MERRSPNRDEETSAATNLSEMIHLKRQESEEWSKVAKMRFCLGSSPDSTFDAVSHIRVGSYYEINHSKLPIKTPDQLKLVRVIMVSKKSKCSVSLRYPSRYSLRAHFSQRNRTKGDTKMLPTLDEQYAMVSEIAGDVLYRRIPPHELSVQRNQWRFWVMEVSPKEQEIGKNPSPTIITSYVNMVLKQGLCWSELLSGGMVRWGRRRLVRFLSPHVQETWTGSVQGQEEEKENEEEDEEEEEEEIIMGADRKSSKRTLHGASLRAHMAKKLKHENDQQIMLYKPSKGREVKNSIERWSVHRYNLAEKNMLKIMKEKGAVFGNPILRPALRLEARKLIGDTGLLDHLLKHMAWKVAPGGEERFMRRHNANGAMEYWLESADLMKIRKEAGVQDPYWTPPPGWKLGDDPTQDPVCARELKELREEIAKLKKGMMENKNTEENLALAITSKSCAASQNMVREANMLLPLKEKYMDLMKLKDKLEGQLGDIGKSLCGVEEEMGKLKSKVEAANALLLMGSTKPPSSTESDRSVLAISDEEVEEEKNPSVARKRRSPVVTREEKAAAKNERLKSGFRICKPQGTFLWPNMGPSSPNGDLAPITTPPVVKYLHTNGLVINLNEVPGIGNPNPQENGYCGSHTHSSPCPLTYQRRHTSMPRMIHGEKEKESMRAPQRGGGYSPRTWLALSTPTPLINNRRV
ncbi:protein DYAD-like [Hibiscus syriacus]|uniref:protein DYAD-like n=1 Tax=Hibiscus syriacus TaxID=106335 RepID=UPI001923BC83|nr:protein DYAD-like [Hibiscus syriacus]